ncbi:MAG: FGGY family carbohydrate kinase, partial [Acidimicrobiales bacterium]|nr:FGGY family carbohydrate kinase [Acidimicrobiales bacterium]
MLLGLDIGTSRTKAVLMDAAGCEVATATVPTPFATTDGRVEMPVAALHDCLGEVLAGLGDRRRQVVAAGVAGIAESGAPLDPAGRALAPVIAWHDERGGEAVALL